MKKLSLLLSALLLAGCGVQNYSSFQRTPQLKRFNISSQSLTAKTGLPLALKEVNKIDTKAQLYEVDVWQEQKGDTIHYGFLKQTQRESYSTIRVSLDGKSGKVSVQELNKGGRVPSPVDSKHWRLDSKKIYALAQKNGLRDREYLATLWESTWHISGLSQHLYFQMDSSSGAIKLRCTGPYLDHCTGADGEPVNPWSQGQDTMFRNYLNSRK